MVPSTTVIANADDAGSRLDALLARRLQIPSKLSTEPPSGVSRSRVQSLIAAGHVRWSGGTARAATIVRVGQTIEVTLPAPVAMGLSPHPIPLAIVFEDALLLVIDKPAHLVVHPGAGTTEATLVHGLLAHCRDLSGIGGVMRPGIVHRLDRDTTGLMVVAKHDLSHQGLAAQFKARTVRKDYLCLTYGVPKSGRSGRLDTAFGRHPSVRHRMTGRLPSAPGVRRAVTDWRVLGDDGRLALMAVALQTGRTHQIRVHLSEMGTSVLGDRTYGSEGAQKAALRIHLDHQALHAARLRFIHPVTGAKMALTAPIPPTWRDVAGRLAIAPGVTPCSV